VDRFFTALGSARIIIWVWALSAWACSAAILATDKDTSVIQAMFHPNSCNAAIVGLIMAAALSPILTAKWMRWYWGALIGNPIGILMMLAFFFLNPTDWHPDRLDAWKSVAIFGSTYYFIVYPICSIAGAASTFLARPPADKPTG
jgi:hypothetical protein